MRTNNALPERSDNLAYSLLRNGAVTTIGATRVSWYYAGEITYSSTWSIGGMVYKYGLYMTRDSMEAGAAINEAISTVADSNPGGVLWINLLVFNLYGCPDLSLDVNSAAPSCLTPEAKAMDQIALSWKDNSYSETRFTIERSDGADFVPVASVGADRTSYLDVGLFPGTRYWYRVRVCMYTGFSDYSEIDSTTTFNFSGPLTPLQPVNIAECQLLLSWQPSPGATTYTIIRSTEQGGPHYVFAKDLTSTSLATTGLIIVKGYIFSVVAVNAAGKSVDSSDTI